jgi:outer membrane protein assembly factor BamB
MLRALGDISGHKNDRKLREEIKKSFRSIVALDKQTGDIAWEKSIERVVATWPNFPYGKLFSLVATEDEVIVRGVKSIAAFDAKNGDKLWSRGFKQNLKITSPVISGSNVYISDLSKSSIIAIDIKSGNKQWRIKVPDCSFYTLYEEYD